MAAAGAPVCAAVSLRKYHSNRPVHWRHALHWHSPSLERASPGPGSFPGPGLAAPQFICIGSQVAMPGNTSTSASARYMMTM
jgi:hypothetical protein